MSWTRHVEYGFDVPVGYLFDLVSYCTVLWLLVAGYLELKLKKEQVASNDRGCIALCGYLPSQ